MFLVRSFPAIIIWVRERVSRKQEMNDEDSDEDEVTTSGKNHSITHSRVFFISDFQHD